MNEKESFKLQKEAYDRGFEAGKKYAIEKYNTKEWVV